MKKTKIIATIIIVLGLIYGAGCWFFTNNLIPNTTLYQSKISKYTDDNLNRVLEKQEIILKLKDSRQQIKIPLKKISYEVKESTSLKKELLKKQNVFKWPLTMIMSQNFDIANLVIDQTSLKQVLKEYKVVANGNLKESKDAYFTFDKESAKAIVNKEIVGEQLDANLVNKVINDDLSKGKIMINLQNAIIKPKVTSAQLEKTTDEVDYKINSNLTITLEGIDYVVKPDQKTKLSWLNIDYKNNKIIVEKDKILSYLKKINDNLIKNGKTTKTVYQVNNGSVNLVSKGSAIKGLNVYEITAKLYNALKNNQELNETSKAVVIAQPKVSYQGNPSIDNDLIEVSIANQQVYLYENGKLTLTADVVTGLPDGTRDTTKGKFTIMYKTTNFTLKGEDYGYDYKLPVSYWLPFENGGGIGLHDAPWRSLATFGGNNYLGDGSHGCINMKLADVRKIYNTVQAGTAVWVH